MKKILLFLALLILASPAFAAVGISINQSGSVSPIGAATNLVVNCPPGASITTDGSNYYTGCNSTLVADGTYNAGAASISSVDTGIPLTYSIVRKTIANGGTSTDQLLQGTPNQVLNIRIWSASGGGTWTVTPTISTGFNSVQFNATSQSCSFLYVSQATGWIILSCDTTGSTASPTINDVGNI